MGYNIPPRIKKGEEAPKPHRIKLKELLQIVAYADLDLYDISTGEDANNPDAHISGKKVLLHPMQCEKLLECPITYIYLHEGKVYVTVYPYPDI